MKLFLMPYAGASAMVYNQLRECIHPCIVTIVFEYKRRGIRSDEEFYNDIHEGVDDAFCFLKQNLQEGENYAIFGHSMGGLFTYELLGRIEKENMKYPLHVFISSRRAPHLKRPQDKKYYLLPDQEFWEELIAIGGIDEDFIHDERIQSYFLPIIRSDYKLIEEYENQNMDIKINCNMTIIFAKNDLEVDKEEVIKWEAYGLKDIEMFAFDGGHFYFKENFFELSNIINNTLGKYK